MIKQAMYTTIITLYKQGISQRQIAKTTKTDRKTVKRIISRYIEDKVESPIGYERTSVLTFWHNEIVELLEKKLSYVRILEELQSKGCNSGYSALTRYIKKHNIKNTTCIRFHTSPGEEAQVVYCTHLSNHFFKKLRFFCSKIRSRFSPFLTQKI